MITTLNVRWLVRSDTNDILDIERASFELPWSEKDFRRVLGRTDVIGMGADDGSRILGYVIYELRPTSMEILNMAVATAWRRERIGTALVERMVNKLHAQRRTSITIEVGDWNLGAQLFFRAMGFLATGVIEKEMDGFEFTAYAMRFDLPVAIEARNGLEARRE